jgi:asparagine synthase (glutamine-hydrolysing)
MCGICGFANTSDQRPFSRQRLRSMCRTIAHRGPDDEGLHIEPHMALGARRLSILDLAGGHQPLANEDGSIWAAHNGEIYNLPDLTRELEAAGHRFRTGTDTEVIVHAYEEWGEDFPSKLRGMFASAVWDGNKKRLLIARDRLGIKPLYYAQTDERTLVFGSELKTILAHGEIRREVEPLALNFFLTLEYIPAPYSIFRGIHKLPPGHMLIYSEERVRLRRYWDLLEEVEAQGPDTRPLHQVMDELYALLEEAVRIRLLSDVPLGAFLSGGIDSSAIVGLMHGAGVKPLRTFSIGFEDQTYNELEYARAVSRRFDTVHEELVIRPRALELTEKLIRHLDEPLGDFSIFPTYLVSEMARKHVTVILSGDGGDEIFGGYEHYQAQKIAALPGMAPGLRALSGVIGSLPPSAKKKGGWNKLRRFAQGLENGRRLRHFRWMMFLSDRDRASLFSPDFITSLGGIRDLAETPPFSDIFARLGGLDPVNGELYLDLTTYLVDNILVKVDRMSMAPSLETRVPLIDHKVVEFIFRQPGRTKLRGLTTKWLFKKTMGRLLPEEIIHRKKEGFSIPIKHWLRTDLRDLLCDTLNEKRIREDGYFNPEAVRTMTDRHLSGRENYSHQLWALLVFALWKTRYLP